MMHTLYRPSPVQGNHVPVLSSQTVNGGQNVPYAVLVPSPLCQTVNRIQEVSYSRESSPATQSIISSFPRSPPREREPVDLMNITPLSGSVGSIFPRFASASPQPQIFPFRPSPVPLQPALEVQVQSDLRTARPPLTDHSGVNTVTESPILLTPPHAPNRPPTGLLTPPDDYSQWDQSFLTALLQGTQLPPLNIPTPH